MSGSLPCVPERARGILQHRFFCSISTGMFYNVLPPQGFRMCSGLGRLLVPVITGPAFRTCSLPAWWSSVLKTWAPRLLPEQDLSSSEKPVSSCECCTPRKPAKLPAPAPDTTLRLTQLRHKPFTLHKADRLHFPYSRHYAKGVGVSEISSFTFRTHPNASACAVGGVALRNTGVSQLVCALIRYQKSVVHLLLW